MSEKGSASAALRQLIQRGSVLAPGCYDTLSAVLAAQAGFETLHVSGFGVEASLLGTPDMGMVSLTELAEVVGRMTVATDLPIICDVDTGFGEVESVARTTRLIAKSGAAGMHIEDCAPPKRNPFLPGQVILPPELAKTRIIAACEAREDDDFVIIARSDADCISIDEVIRRCNLYLAAGADAALPCTKRLNGGSMSDLPVDEQMKWHEYITSRIEGPVVSMTMPAGQTAGAMFEAGYCLMLLPTVAVLPAAQAMWRSLLAASPNAPAMGEISSPLDMMQRMGIDDFVARQDRYAERERKERNNERT